jgi:hypothetical protein
VFGGKLSSREINMVSRCGLLAAACLAISATLITATKSHCSDDAKPKGGIQPVDPQKFLNALCQYIKSFEFAAEVDELTEQQSAIREKGAGTPHQEGTHLVFTYRVPEIELESSLTNSIWGVEIPGRTLSAAIRVDCLVHCWIDPDRIRGKRDPNVPTRLNVQGPNFSRFTAEFPENEFARYENEYGFLRSKYLDGAKATRLREELYQHAKTKAIDQVKDYLLTDRDSLVQGLQKDLQSLFPNNPVTAVTDNSGILLSLDNYLKAPSSWQWLVVVGVASVLVVGLLLVFRSRQQLAKSL